MIGLACLRNVPDSRPSGGLAAAGYSEVGSFVFDAAVLDVDTGIRIPVKTGVWLYELRGIASDEPASTRSGQVKVSRVYSSTGLGDVGADDDKQGLRGGGVGMSYSAPFSIYLQIAGGQITVRAAKTNAGQRFQYRIWCRKTEWRPFT
jgi:hypothetical protein